MKTYLIIYLILVVIIKFSKIGKRRYDIADKEAELFGDRVTKTEFILLCIEMSPFFYYFLTR